MRRRIILFIFSSVSHSRPFPEVQASKNEVILKNSPLFHRLMVGWDQLWCSLDQGLDHQQGDGDKKKNPFIRRKRQERKQPHFF